MTTPSYYLSPEIVSTASRDSKKASTFRITGIAPQPLLNTTSSHRKPYRHRQQDSFHAKETRTDEDVTYDEHRKGSSRCAAPEEARTVPPMETTNLESTRVVPPIESTLLECKVVPLVESAMIESRVLLPKELTVLEVPGRVLPPREESTIFESTTVAPLKESTILEDSSTSATLSIKSTIQSLIDSGCQQYELGHYERAESEFRNALQACHSPKVAAVLYGNLGATYLQLGDYETAKMYLQKCWHGKQNYKSVVEESMVDLLINLGNVVACENLEESVYWYQLALEEQLSGEEKTNVLFNLGRVYAQHQHWEDAKAYLEQAHAVTKQVHGEHHMFMAQILDLVGLIHMAQGKYDPAMVAYTNAMAIYRRLHGPIHRTMAQSLHDMGILREAKGELSDAWEAYTTAHELLTRLLTSPDDPLLQMVSHSIHMVESLIAKQNRDRMQRITV